MATPIGHGYSNRNLARAPSGYPAPASSSMSNDYYGVPGSFHHAPAPQSSHYTGFGPGPGPFAPSDASYAPAPEPIVSTDGNAVDPHVAFAPVPSLEALEMFILHNKGLPVTHPVWQMVPRTMFPHFDMPRGTYQVPDDPIIVSRTPSDKNICLPIPPVSQMTIEEIELRLNFAPIIHSNTREVRGSITIDDSAISSRMRNAFVTRASVSFDNPSPFDVELTVDGLQNRVYEYGCVVGENDVTCSGSSISAMVYASREVSDYTLFKTSKELGKEFEKWGMLTEDMITRDITVSRSSAIDAYDVPANHVLTYYLAINRNVLDYINPDLNPTLAGMDGEDTLEAFVMARHQATGFATMYTFPRDTVDNMSKNLRELVTTFNKRDLSKIVYKITGPNGKNICDLPAAKEAENIGINYALSGKLTLSVIVKKDIA